MEFYPSNPQVYTPPAEGRAIGKFYTQPQDTAEVPTLERVLAVDGAALPTPTLPTASATVKGGVKVGNGLSIADAVLSANGYTLPTASATVKGGVKVGSGLTIQNEILSATGGSSETLHQVLTNGNDATGHDIIDSTRALVLKGSGGGGGYDSIHFKNSTAANAFFYFWTANNENLFAFAIYESIKVEFATTAARFRFTGGQGQLLPIAIGEPLSDTDADTQGARNSAITAGIAAFVAAVNAQTTDPQVAGQWWNDNGTVKISTGV
jgi:hypothetical protein